MVQPGLLVLEAEEHVVIDVLVVPVTAVERTDEVVLALHVHVVRADEAQRVTEPLHGLLQLRRPHDPVPNALDRRRILRQPHQLAGPPQGFRARVHRIAAHRNRGQLLDAPHHLDLIAVGFLETDALAPAGLVDVLDARGSGTRATLCKSSSLAA